MRMAVFLLLCADKTLTSKQVQSAPYLILACKRTLNAQTHFTRAQVPAALFYMESHEIRIGGFGHVPSSTQSELLLNITSCSKSVMENDTQAHIRGKGYRR
eukprot:6198212-Pleurochrysis_carterae.AAC.4